MNLMSSLMQNLAGDAVKELMSGKNSDLIQALAGQFTQNGGQGMQTMLEQFKQNGLGDAVSSWIGKGENQNITAEQISQGMGEAKVAEIAQAANMQPQDAAAQMAKLIPQVIDQLTPNGQLDVGAALSMIQMFVGKKAA